jgi:CRP/FNR family transcriptional regulator, anaerobic regulatory protein
MKNLQNKNLLSVLQKTVNFIPKELVLKRSENLISEGEKEQSIYIIIDGAVHAFYRQDGIEISIRFGYNGSIITSLSSLISGEPSDLSIQALRKTRYLKIPADLFYHAISINLELNNLYRSMLEDLVIQQMEREIDLLTIAPIERYERVLKRSPNLFQQIPAKYIASYLRMTPETLSRIRKS